MNKTKKTTQILKISNDVFTQRKRVIKMLYEAREILGIDLPRIKVRIAKYEELKDKKILGRCFINQNYITISEDMSNWTDDYLRGVVWHELGHAYFNAQHDDKCPLMSAYCNEAQDRNNLIIAFKKLASKFKTNDCLKVA